MSVPSWAPTLEQVGDYITSRTVDTVTPGSDTPSGTFSNDTYPTDLQVDRLIEAACRWVMAVTGALQPTVTDTGTDVAATRAAGMVELSYPVRDNEINETAQTLLADASTGRENLAALNRAAGGSVTDPNAAPLSSFPDAPLWRGDSPVRLPGWSW